MMYSGMCLVNTRIPVFINEEMPHVPKIQSELHVKVSEDLMKKGVIS